MNDLWELAEYRREVVDNYVAARAGGPGREAWEAWRAQRDALLGSHPQSPVPVARRAGYEAAFFAYREDWRLLAAVAPAESLTLEIPHSGAGSTRFERFAIARARHGDEAIDLDVYWLDAYGGGIFVPFRDTTCGATTYGGGRYLLDGAKGADLGGGAGELVMDFNYAYHPSCAHDSRWSCPLAPPGNRLVVPVEAGERLVAA